MICAVAVLQELAMGPNGEKIWREPEGQCHPALPTVYIAREKSQKVLPSYTILEEVGDPLLSTHAIREATSAPRDFSAITVDALFDLG